MRLPQQTIVLAVDETMLRMYPPLRSAWARRGQQAHVPISGQNARRVLLGAINIRTGHRILSVARSQKQDVFHDFLRKIRRAYPGRPICLLLDKHGSHKAAATMRLLKQLAIKAMWLPVQSPELNPMDHLWRHLKARIAANRQHDSVDALADAAVDWIISLTHTQARRLAGLDAIDHWLRRLSQNFCGPT